MIKDGLPTLALLRFGIDGFRIECDTDLNRCLLLRKRHADHTIIKLIFNALHRDNLPVDPNKVETHTAILGLHTIRKLTIDPKVRASMRGFPVRRGTVPVLDILRCVISVPNQFEWGLYPRGDADFGHGSSPLLLF